MIVSLLVLGLFSMVARADLWRTGYYPGWEQSGMPASNIDFTALTHIIHFSVVPNSNGTLDSSVFLAPLNHSLQNGDQVAAF